MRSALLVGLIGVFTTGCDASVAPPGVEISFPPIGIIDLYGARQVTETDIRTALGVSVGQDAPDDAARRAARERLMALPGVRNARLEIVCCEDSHTILYVGIEEDEAPAWTLRPRPAGDERLPDEVIAAGAEHDEAMMRAVLAGRTREDVSQGHSLSEDSAARAIEDRFVAFADEHFDVLRRVLAASSDDQHRALAADVLAYADDKRLVIADLVRATEDPSDDVRNNAIRALGVIAAAEQLPADVRAAVPAAPFVRLLNSPIWSDRNKALFVLETLSADRDPELLAVLRRDAWPSLVEMARWTSQGHAQPAFILLGRMTDLDDKAIFGAWKRGERERVIAAAAQHASAMPQTSPR